MSEPPHPAALQGQWPERGQAEPDGALTLDALEPDAFAAVCEHLEQADVAALTASCSALSHAVRSNDRLWSRWDGSPPAAGLGTLGLACD